MRLSRQSQQGESEHFWKHSCSILWEASNLPSVDPFPVKRSLCKELPTSTYPHTSFYSCPFSDSCFQCASLCSKPLVPPPPSKRHCISDSSFTLPYADVWKSTLWNSKEDIFRLHSRLCVLPETSWCNLRFQSSAFHPVSHKLSYWRGSWRHCGFQPLLSHMIVF